MPQGNKNIAVIGAGYWGKNLIRNFHELGVLHSVCDSDPSLFPFYQKQYSDVRFEQDYRNLINDTAIEACVIAVPAVFHYEVAKFFLENNRHVFVEKPLSLHVHEGEDLVALAKRKDRILMVGHVLHYHPAVQKIKSLVEQGSLGQIRYIYSNRLNHGRFRTEENILWSFAPHDISVILSLAGSDPLSVLSVGEPYINKDVEDTTLSYLSFESGLRAHIFVSWLHPFKEHRLVVIGSEKMVVFEDTSGVKEKKLLLYEHRIEWKNDKPVPVNSTPLPLLFDATEEPLKQECKAFIQAFHDNISPITDGDEGLHVVKVLQQLQESINKKGEVIYSAGN